MEENIRAEHTFYERGKIDRANANKKRESPDVSEMYGIRIDYTVQGAITNYITYWFGTKARRDKRLPAIKARYDNPIVTFIGKK